MSVVGANISFVVTYKHVCIMAAPPIFHSAMTPIPKNLSTNSSRPLSFRMQCGASLAIKSYKKKKKGK